METFEYVRMRKTREHSEHSVVLACAMVLFGHGRRSLSSSLHGWKLVLLPQDNNGC